MVWITQSVPAYHQSVVIHPYYRAWRDQSKSLASVAAYDLDLWKLTITGRTEAERINAIRVTAGLLPQLGAQPEIGRLFTGEEDRGTLPHVALLTHGFWERRYGGDHSILGQAIILNGCPLTVVGVLRASFEFPD